MAAIDHWHPACKLAALRKGPVGIVVDGHQIAVFRTAGGELGALDDVCPHRRMRLSKGTVVGERLQCAYHGWTYDACGAGESPGTPKLFCQATTYETRAADGWAWVRAAGADTPFPELEQPGFDRIGEFDYGFDVPLELVLDNFTEAEHTGVVHEFFGYPTDRLHEVECQVTHTPTSVTVRNYGPQKPVAWVYRRLMGIRVGDHLIDEWTTHFAPLYSVYDFHYDSPRTGRKGLLHQRAAFFFIPEGPAKTRVVVWLYFKYGIKWMQRRARPFYGLLRHRFHSEVLKDQKLLANLADYEPGIEGLKLSRFDKVLGLTRERIQRVYRGDKRRALA